MKKFFAAIALVSSLSTSVLWAAPQPGDAGDFGLGAVFGSPTGFTGKYWMDGVSAIDGALAWHFGDPDRLHIHGDYLYHMDIRNLNIDGRLPFYFGLGMRILAGHDTKAGIRIPLGLSYLVPRAPFEFFAELAPIINFAPNTDGDLDGGIGIRFYFK